MKKLFNAFALMLIALGISHSSHAQTPQQNGGCTTAIDRCTAKPTPKPCPPGSNWTLAGTGVAHCVIPAPPPPPPAPPAPPTPPAPPPFGTCANGAADWPTCTPPAQPTGTCANGAADWPTCTPPAPPPFGTCANGAADWPTCTPPAPPTGTCANGAADWPTCTPPINPPVSCPGNTSAPTTCPPGKTGIAFLTTTYSAAPLCIPSTFTDESLCTTFAPPLPPLPRPTNQVSFYCNSENTWRNAGTSPPILYQDSYLGNGPLYTSVQKDDIARANAPTIVYFVGFLNGGNVAAPSVLAPGYLEYLAGTGNTYRVGCGNDQGT